MRIVTVPDGLESWIDVGEGGEASQQQASADEEHDGKRHLHDDQAAPHPMMATIRCRSATARGERGVGLDPACLPRGHQAEHERRQGRRVPS